MTEDDKIKEWKYEFAWKQLENAQSRSDSLDNKAMNNINYSTLMIPIVSGILLYISDNSIRLGLGHIIIAISVIYLMICIAFAYATLWLRDQGTIKTWKHFEAIDGFDLDDTIDGTSTDLSDWQGKVVVACEYKSKYLNKSYWFFASALTLIAISPIVLWL